MLTELVDILVQVTTEDIGHGERGECDTCPIARAISRATGKVVLVTSSMFCFDEFSDMDDYPLPKEACEFIFNFDGDGSGPVFPFSFTISVPASYLEFSPCNSAGDGR